MTKRRIYKILSSGDQESAVIGTVSALKQRKGFVSAEQKVEN